MGGRPFIHRKAGRCLENKGCPVMQISFLGKIISGNSSLLGTSPLSNVKIGMVEKKAKNFFESTGFLLHLAQIMFMPKDIL